MRAILTTAPSQLRSRSTHSRANFLYLDTGQLPPPSDLSPIGILPQRWPFDFLLACDFLALATILTPASFSRNSLLLCSLAPVIDLFFTVHCTCIFACCFRHPALYVFMTWLCICRHDRCTFTVVVRLLFSQFRCLTFSKRGAL